MTEFTCEELIEQLLEFVEGQLDEPVLIAIQAHLGHCPHCGGVVATYRATVVVTRALPRCAPPLPAGFEMKLRLLLEQDDQPK